MQGGPNAKKGRPESTSAKMRQMSKNQRSPIRARRSGFTSGLDPDDLAISFEEGNGNSPVTCQTKHSCTGSTPAQDLATGNPHPGVCVPGLAENCFGSDGGVGHGSNAEAVDQQGAMVAPEGLRSVIGPGGTGPGRA